MLVRRKNHAQALMSWIDRWIRVNINCSLPMGENILRDFLEPVLHSSLKELTNFRLLILRRMVRHHSSTKVAR
jgi:hypothetical protein